MAKRQRGSGFKPDDRRLWVGTLESIPRGWMVDPDFNDRALVGAGNAYSVKQKFGSDSRTPSISVGNHTLSTQQMPHHNHSYNTGTSPNSGSGSNDVQGTSTHYSTNRSTNHNGSSWGHNHGASSSAIDTRQTSIGVYVIKRIR